MTDDWETIEVQSIIDENVRLRTENEEFKKALVELKEIGDYQDGRIKELSDENEQLKSENIDLRKDLGEFEKSINIQGLIGENEQLKSENKRLTDKLNKTALELVDECISQGKATEISEMGYREFLDYRAENGKPMELQL